MDRCTGNRDITEILLENSVKHHTINQSVNQMCKSWRKRQRMFLRMVGEYGLDCIVNGFENKNIRCYRFEML